MTRTSIVTGKKTEHMGASDAQRVDIAIDGSLGKSLLMAKNQGGEEMTGEIEPESTELCDHQSSIKNPSEVCGQEFKAQIGQHGCVFSHHIQW